MEFLIQFSIVLICILVGARIGGIGLGVIGGLGLLILTFVFNLAPTSPPIDVMLMILAVVTAAACMQAAGGLDYMVKIAEKILRKNPKNITFIAPAVTYIFTIFAGTGHVAYSVLPVIAEVARHTGVRPERPLSMAVLASQFSIVASPISAAVVMMVGFLADYQLGLLDILMVTIPSSALGLLVACFVMNYMGKELKDDPEYQRRLQDPEFRAEIEAMSSNSTISETPATAKLSVVLFLIGAIAVVILGGFKGLRPAGASVPVMIEIIMLSVGGLIILLCKPNGDSISKGSVFNAGMRAVIAIFGIAWLGDTLFAAHMDMLSATIQTLVENHVWIFAIALFVLSILVNSQGATTAVLMPLGLKLGIDPAYIIAMFVAVNGYFFVPNYGPIIASVDFDRTGTTRIGKYVFNHSFMIPGLISIICGVGFGFLFAQLFLK